MVFHSTNAPHVIHFDASQDSVCNQIATISINFTRVTFVHNSYVASNHSNLLFKSSCTQFREQLLLRMFYLTNKFSLLQVLSINTPLSAGHSRLVIFINGYFLVHSNINHDFCSNLISLKYIHIQFHGVNTFFQNAVAEIIHSSFSMLSFSNSTYIVS